RIGCGLGRLRLGDVWLANEVLPNRGHRKGAECRSSDVCQQHKAKLLIGHKRDLRVETVNVAAMLRNLVAVPLAQEPAEAVVNVSGDVDLLAQQLVKAFF